MNVVYVCHGNILKGHYDSRVGETCLYVFEKAVLASCRKGFDLLTFFGIRQKFLGREVRPCAECYWSDAAIKASLGRSKTGVAFQAYDPARWARD